MKGSFIRIPTFFALARCQLQASVEDEQDKEKGGGECFSAVVYC